MKPVCKKKIDLQSVIEDEKELTKLQALCCVFGVKYTNTSECRIIVARHLLRDMSQRCQFDCDGIYSSFADYVDKLLSDALKHCLKIEKVIV